MEPTGHPGCQRPALSTRMHRSGTRAGRPYWRGSPRDPNPARARERRTPRAAKRRAAHRIRRGRRRPLQASTWVRRAGAPRYRIRGRTGRRHAGELPRARSTSAASLFGPKGGADLVAGADRPPTRAGPASIHGPAGPRDGRSAVDSRSSREDRSPAPSRRIASKGQCLTGGRREAAERLRKNRATWPKCLSDCGGASARASRSGIAAAVRPRRGGLRTASTVRDPQVAVVLHPPTRLSWTLGRRSAGLSAGRSGGQGRGAGPGTSVRTCARQAPARRRANSSAAESDRKPREVAPLGSGTTSGSITPWPG